MADLPNISGHVTDSRFQHLEDKVSGLETTIGGMQSTLGSLVQGFQAIRDDLRESRQLDANKPATVKVSVLFSMLGFLGFCVSAGIAAFWAAVLLLFDPIKEDLRNHQASDSHGYAEREIPLIREKAEETKREVDAMAEDAKALNRLKYEFGRFQGRQEAINETLRDK